MRFVLPQPSRFLNLSTPNQVFVSINNSAIDYNVLQNIYTLVSDEDLKGLIDKLRERNEDAELWENVIQESNTHVSYTAKCCKPKDGGPMKYLSVTVFDEDCSPEILRDFYMDNEYRKQWDKTVVEHEQLRN